MAGLDITGYEYALSTSANNVTYSSYGSYLASSWSSGNTFTITGLTNGTYYKIKLRAVNSLGKGQESAVIGPFLPRTTPGLPVFSSASSGNGTYTINWTAPVDTGGAPVTSYTVELTTANQTAWNGATVSTGITGTSKTFTGLTNGASYRARVLAVTAGGSGSYMDPYPSGQQTPSTTPGSPTYRDASAVDKTYTLKWNAPADNGGAAVTYTVQVTDANQQNWSTSVSGVTATEYTFTGLTNGASYRAQVRADNVRGSSGYFDNGAQTARTPSFAAPGISSSADWATSIDPYRGWRRMDWAVDPTDISGSTATTGTTTYVYRQLMYADNTYSNPFEAEELMATYTGNQYAANSTYSAAPGQQYRIRAVQSDGSHSVSSGWVNVQVLVTQTTYYNDWAYTNGVNVYTTGNFTVNGSSYFNVSDRTIPGVNSANLGDTQYEITLLKVTATGSSSSSASTSARNFTVKYAGPHAANATTNSMPNVQNTSSASNGWSGAGNVSMLYDFNVSNIGYGYAGLGYVAVDGGGTLTSWTPTIIVSIEARGNKRTMTQYSYTW